MKELQVSFDTIRDVEQFVRIATAAVGSVRVSIGDRVTNGKSILGLISMGLSKTLTVAFDGSDAEYHTFLTAISDFLVTN